MKTSELTGAALDWAVAKCEGKLITLLCGVMVRDNDGMLSPTKANPLINWSPSTDWAQGGPIIEREKLTLDFHGDHWTALMWWDDSNTAGEFTASGHTPLIAAMRCFVASKLGDDVDIPEGLTD